jgi:hypothetical protein
MRGFAVLCLALLPACASVRGGSQNNVTVSLGATPDSVLRIATTQLQLHGYQVSRIDDKMLVTLPRPIPNYLREVSTREPGLPGNEWILQLTTEPLVMVRGTRLRVSGFVVPKRPSVSPGNTVAESAIPVDARNQMLFREISVVADWIEDATIRAAKERRGKA